MKIGKVEVTRCEEILVLPRPSGDLVFRAVACTCMDEFDKVVKEPKCPGITTRDGFKEDPDDENYKSVLAAYYEKRYAFMAINSLIPSEIEWAEVDLDKPKTWKNWDKELGEAGLSTMEIGRVNRCIMVANSLDEEKIAQARENFLLGQGQ
jgi:hypothetical protein